MSWEIATSVGLVGIAGLLLYLSTIIETKHWPMKLMLQVFAFWIMLTDLNFLQDIIATHGQAGLSTIMQTVYFNFQWLIIFFIVYFIIWFFYNTVQMVEVMLAERRMKKQKRAEGE